MLGAALVAFSQGVAYFHAGMEALRSKSLDRNSFDAGDGFNRIDWSFSTNHFGTGLPSERENAASWAVMRPFLADRSLAPGPAELAWSRAVFNDLLRIRSSSTLWRLRSADEVMKRLTLLNTGAAQNPAVLAASLDGRGLAGSGFERIVYFVNTHPEAQRLVLPSLAGAPLVLHPVHLAPQAGDTRPREQARFDGSSGEVVVPGRTALVYVQEAGR
jgi:pullulanase/glycogen debranching enzyme